MRLCNLLIAGGLVVPSVSAQADTLIDVTIQGTSTSTFQGEVVYRDPSVTDITLVEFDIPGTEYLSGTGTYDVDTGALSTDFVSAQIVGGFGSGDSLYSGYWVSISPDGFGTASTYSFGVLMFLPDPDGIDTDVGRIETVSDFSISAVTTTPEPSSFALLGTGLLVVAGVAKRRFA